MKLKFKLLSAMALACGLASVVYAAGPGFYLGAGIGMSKLNNQERSIVINPNGTTATVNPSNTGVGGRIYLGYQANNYFGMEMGGSYYTPSKYKVTGLAGNALCSDPTIKQSTYEFLATGTLPFFTSGLSVFGKAGLAVAMQSQSGSLESSSGTCGGTDRAKTSAEPAFIVGLGYDITQNWMADISFMHVQQVASGGVKSADLATIGLSYHFVDKMCGQFLC
jgi:opacity protein-like surface antigen